mgnify:CR=1 FL=1
MNLFIKEPKEKSVDNFLISRKTIVFKKNQVIYKANHDIENIYIILSGNIYSVYDKKSTSEKNILLEKGSILGLIDLILDRRYSKFMIAKKDSVLAIINKNKILDLLKPNCFKSILLKSLAIDVDTNNPNLWS